MTRPLKLAEASHVSGVLEAPDERGTLVILAHVKTGAIVALPVNLN